MPRHFLLVAIALLVSLVSGEVQAQSAAFSDPLKACAELSAAGRFADALAPCRQAFEASPSSLDAARNLARCEFEEGDAGRAAELWKRVSLANPADFDSASGEARSLWRAGRTGEAEAAFRANLAKGFGPSAFHDLVEFYIGFGRWGEAETSGLECAAAHPRDCRTFELLAASTAPQEKDNEAASYLLKARALGCPPFRWTAIGTLAGRAEAPAYRPLLDPGELVKGLESLPFEECVGRLQMLKFTGTSSQSLAVSTLVLDRPERGVRSLGLAILEKWGQGALEAWRRVLSSPDIVLRKLALRQLADSNNTAFTPLLEERLKSEAAPQNRSLAAYALAGLLTTKGESGRAESLLQTIPQEDPIHPQALVRLASLAEARGDRRLALDLLERALKENPALDVDPARLDRLRAAVPTQGQSPNP